MSLVKWNTQFIGEAIGGANGADIGRAVPDVVIIVTGAVGAAKGAAAGGKAIVNIAKTAGGATKDAAKAAGRATGVLKEAPTVARASGEKAVAKDMSPRVIGTPELKATGNTKKPMNDAGEYIDFKKMNELELLDRKYRAHMKAQKEAVQIKELPDGRTRYYSKEKLSDTPGPTRGSAFVTEYDAATGRIRTWMESYDHMGNVNRAHPKMTNGIPFNSQHYPPTGAELKLLSK